MENYTLTIAPKPEGTNELPKQDQPLDNGAIIHAQCVLYTSQARVNEAQVFLNGLGEIRMALNLPQVVEGDSGLGDRTKLQPLFEDLDIKRLRERYITLLDRYLNYAKQQEQILVK